MASARQQMTVEERNAVLGMHKQGFSCRKIAQIFKRSDTTIGRLLKRFERSGSVKSRSIPGRPSKTSDRDHRALSKIIRTNRRQDLSDITTAFNQGKEDPKQCSQRTVQRKLHHLGYSNRSVRKTIVVREVNRKKRMNWCRSKLQWTIANWKDILFTDEMMVVLSGDNGHIKVWRRVGEEWRPECLGILKQSPPCSLKIMVWGCISYFGTGSFAFIDGSMKSEDYIEVLDNHLWPSVCKLFGANRWVLQEDNASIHKSRLSTQWKTDNNISTLPWPAQSPDLNIIENVWLVMKKHVKKRSHLIASVDDLKRELRTAWENVPLVFIRRLFESLPRRLRAVLTQKGNITKY